MGAVMDVEAAALAAKTKPVKIVLLANPAATVANQLRLAEELGKRLLFGGAFAHFARPEWMFPPGYNSREAARRLAPLDGPNT